jgi:ABC-type transporter Mla subunit MlaD
MAHTVRRCQAVRMGSDRTERTLIGLFIVLVVAQAAAVVVWAVRAFG